MIPGEGESGGQSKKHDRKINSSNEKINYSGFAVGANIIFCEFGNDQSAKHNDTDLKSQQ